MHEQTVRLFVRALIYGAQVLSHVHDPFMQHALYDALRSCVQQGIRADEDIRTLREPVRELHSCLEDISRNGAAPLRTLLLAERHVLLLLVHIGSIPPVRSSDVRSVKGHRVSASRPDASEHREPEMREPKGSANGYMTDAMRTVLRHLGSEPTRAKDIIQRCHTLSERTVRRSLKDLQAVGLIIRDTQSGTVLYRAVNKA